MPRIQALVDSILLIAIHIGVASSGDIAASLFICAWVSHSSTKDIGARLFKASLWIILALSLIFSTLSLHRLRAWSSKSASIVSSWASVTAMALVGVTGLVEPEALIEIETLAVLPEEDA